jgi:DNA-binding SARP family transcriptional activator
VEIAVTAVSLEPLRESAQLVLAEAHLAEGNLVEMLRCFRAYRHLLDTELGVEPGQRLMELVEGACRVPVSNYLDESRRRPSLAALSAGLRSTNV